MVGFQIVVRLFVLLRKWIDILRITVYTTHKVTKTVKIFSIRLKFKQKNHSHTFIND